MLQILKKPTEMNTYLLLKDLRLKAIEVYSMSNILAIHNYLSQDVYTWSGQYRKVNISKSDNPFMLIQSFNASETYINHLIHSYHQTANSKDGNN